MNQHFEHGHILADAMPRPHGKRDIGEPMPLFGIGAGEALGPKLLRLAPEGRMSMQHIRTDEHIGARRYREAAEFVRLERAAGEQPARRIQPQRLLQYLVGECQ